MRIQEVMAATGLSKKALQYYEDKGLIHVHKDLSGYREFDEESVYLLRQFKVFRKLDFSVTEIEKLLCNEDCESIFRKHFNELDKRMAQCTIQKTYIQQLYEDMDMTQDDEWIQANRSKYGRRYAA